MRSCFPVKDAAKNTEAITSECWRTRIFTHFSREACSSLSKKQISAVKKTSDPHIWYNAYNNLTSKKKTRTLIYPTLRRVSFIVLHGVCVGTLSIGSLHLTLPSLAQIQPQNFKTNPIPSTRRNHPCNHK